MQLFASLLYVCVAIAFIRPTTSDTTSDDGATECTIVLEEGRSVNDKMYERAHVCFYQIANHFGNMESNPSAEVIRTTFTTFCGRLPELLQCLDELEPDARACLDETQHTRYRLYRQYKELNFKVGCEDNGVDVAVIFRDSIRDENSDLKGCQENATAQVQEMNAVDPNGFVVRKYKEMHKTRECLEEHKGQGHDLNWAITMYTKVMDRLKCFKDGADVLCKTIVDNMYPFSKFS